MFEVIKKSLAVKVAATAPELSTQEDCAHRADELFREQQQEIYRNTDELFARLMVVQWIACIVMAAIISPYTWAGETRVIHIHVWAAIFLGGAISVFPIWLTRVWPGAAITRHIIAIAQMLMSALLISVSGGRIETHFHVFGSLVILSFYRDWRVLVPATIVVALDHFLRGIYWPYSVYGVLAASPWRSMEHAAWVVFEDVFLVISCVRSIREMRSIANRTAALEASEQTFRQIFQDGPMGVALVDLEQRFVKVNASLCHLLGYSSEELIGKNTLDLTYPEDRHLDHEIVAELRDGATRSAFEKRYICKDGSLRWVNLTAAVIRDEHGQPHHYITMMKDLSPRKRVEEELRKLNQSLEQRVQERTGELLAAEERYRLLFDRNPEPMWVFDLETLAFLEVNQAAVHHYGYSREEFLRMTLKDIRPANDLAALIQDIKRLQDGATEHQSFWKHRKKDGTLIDVSITSNAFEWKGRPTRLVLAIDVTERKQVEEALRKSEEQYRLIADNMTDTIWVRDLNLNLIYISPSVERLRGSSVDELKRIPLNRLLTPQSLDLAMHALEEELAKERLPEVDRNRTRTLELEHYHNDGSTFWSETKLTLIRDNDGKPTAILGAGRDITERKRAEETLRETEQKYRAIFENAVQGIFQTTPEGTYLNVNPALTRMFGYESPEELMAVSDISRQVYVDPERRNEFKRVIEAAGFIELFEYEVYRKDGRKIWLCENARAVRDPDGKVLYYEGTVEDITERKLVDEVMRASKAKSEFLSRMSHELRTPLNAILGFAQLLDRQKPTAIQKKRLEYILNAGRHLLDLINEVLDISRIEAGRMELSLEPVCVADALEETLDLMRPLATERAIHLSASVDLDAGIYVLADRQRFKQVLLNLLNNAVKYTPLGGAVTVSYQLNGDDKVRIIVSDTGPGISTEKLARLFVPFERLGAELSTVEGTGLGLALSQRLMQAMSGSIGLDSSVGRGSTFWLELPRIDSPLDQVPVRLAKNRPQPSKLEPHSRSILYIEDNLSNVTLIEQMLAERPGTALLTTMQGKVGFDLARQHLPDLILLDLHLPDLPGWDVLAQLKADVATRDIPVVVISADATKRQIDRLMCAGAAHYLTKPLDVTKFFDVLDKMGPPPNGKEELAEIESTQ